MARQVLKFKITGEAPLLLHNGQTADPLNQFSKAMKQITSKRAKTDADFAEMARIEWMASVYLDNGRICVPSEVWESAIVSGAKKLKLGKSAQAAIFCPSNSILEFEGCKMSLEELWKRDHNRLTVGVRVGTNKVMRTRFKAEKWSTELEVSFDDSILNESQVRDMLRITGEQCGLCDWRPKFGRFSVK